MPSCGSFYGWKRPRALFRLVTAATTPRRAKATPQGEYGCDHGGNILSELHFFYDTQSRPAMAGFHGALYSYVHDLQGGRGYY